MNYASIKKHDIANGPGVRVSLFVSGCTHHCVNCFNPETWDFAYGNLFTEETINEIIEALKPSYIRGLTLLGGDPFEYANQRGLIPLLTKVKFMYPEKDIWCYTGYDYEKDIMNDMIKKWPVTTELLSMIDILVDGEFIEAEKDLKLKFRGSRNQKIIDVKASRANDSVTLWVDNGLK